MAQIAEDLFLLLLDNAAAQPGLEQGAVSGYCRGGSAGSRLRLPYPARGTGDPVETGQLLALAAPGPSIPSPSRLSLLRRAARWPGAAVSKLRKDTQAEPHSDISNDRRDSARPAAVQAIHALLRLAADQPRSGGPCPRRAVVGVVRPPPADPSTAAIISLLHAADGLGALLSLNDRGWRWVHARASEIASGSWVDEYPTALPEMNLAVTASAVRPALM